MPWESTGGYKEVQGQSFFFKFTSQNEAYKISQKSENTQVYHDRNFLTATTSGRFRIADQAHLNENSSGWIVNGIWQMPEEIDRVRKTYLAGSEHFRLREIEVYQVSDRSYSNPGSERH